MTVVMADKTTFSVWLKPLVYAAGFGTNSFAQAVGVSSPSASAWMNGKSVPEERRCYAIASVLNVPVEEVLDQAGYPVPIRPAILDRPDAVEPPQPKFSIRALSPEEQAQFLAEVAEARKLLQGIEQRWGISVQAPAEANTD